MERLDGVHHIEIDLQTNLVVITPELREELPLSDVPRAIKGAGFVPADMNVRARGRYRAVGDHLFFQIRGWRTLFEVRALDRPPEGENLLRAAVDYSSGRVVLEPLR